MLHNPSSVGVGLARAIPLGRRSGSGTANRRPSTSALTDKGSTAAWRRTRVIVLMRDRHTCQYCGAYGNTVDHKVPRRMGGTDALSNLVACCVSCQTPEARPDPLCGVVGLRDHGGMRVLSPRFLNGAVPRHRAVAPLSPPNRAYRFEPTGSEPVRTDYTRARAR